MQERRAGLAARQHVVHRGQRIEIDLDPGRDVFRLAGGRRDAHGDGLADMPHLVARQHRLRRRLESGERGVGPDRQDPVEVGGDEHAVAQLRRNPDRPDARMGDRAAQEHHMLHARQIDVADELAQAADVALVFLSRQPRANSLGAHAFPSAMHLSRSFPVYGRDERNRSAAPAKAGACGVRGRPTVPPPQQPDFWADIPCSLFLQCSTRRRPQRARTRGIGSACGDSIDAGGTGKGGL